MIEEFEYTGLWWLPETPEKQICGTLRFTPIEGAVLELMDSFIDAKTKVRIVSHEVIIGRLSYGKDITLYKCRLKSYRGFQESFRADVVFMGAHFQKFDVFLRNWFKQAKPSELKPTHDLYFGTLYIPLMYRESHFLSLAQAAESFHRRKYRGKYLSDKDYKEIPDVLVNAIPLAVKKYFKNSLENKLKYSNEFSLRKRLKEIFDEYQHEIPGVFIKNKGAFIDNVVDTINYLTHYDKDLKERAASGNAIFHLTQELKTLLEICLLRELGFGSEEIEDRSSKLLRGIGRMNLSNSTSTILRTATKRGFR